MQKIVPFLWFDSKAEEAALQLRNSECGLRKWPALSFYQRGLAGRELRVAGGDRSLLGEAGRGWGRAARVRLAQGQVRDAVADRAGQGVGVAAG